MTAVDIDEHDLRDTATMVAEGYDGWAAVVVFAGAYTAANQAENNVLLIAWASMRWCSQRSRSILIVQVLIDYTLKRRVRGTDPVVQLDVYSASKLRVS